MAACRLVVAHSTCDVYRHYGVLHYFFSADTAQTAIETKQHHLTHPVQALSPSSLSSAHSQIGEQTKRTFELSINKNFLTQRVTFAKVNNLKCKREGEREWVNVCVCVGKESIAGCRKQTANEKESGRESCRQAVCVVQRCQLSFFSLHLRFKLAE